MNKLTSPTALVVYGMGFIVLANVALVALLYYPPIAKSVSEYKRVR